MKIGLKDFEIRYAGLRENYPERGKCGFKGCPNPIDWTEGMGWDTSCAYHRLLFDHWLCVVRMGDIPTNQKSRRRLFSMWVKRIGKKRADSVVLDLAQDMINWKC